MSSRRGTEDPFELPEVDEGFPEPGIVTDVSGMDPPLIDRIAVLLRSI